MIFLLTSCIFGGGGTNQEDFWDDYFAGACKLAEECDESFGDSFDSVDDCVTQTTALLEAFGFMECYDTCEYNDESGDACMESLNGASCSDYDSSNFGSSCTTAWDCSNGDPELCGYYYYTTTTYSD